MDDDDDVMDEVEGWEEEESHDPDIPAVRHKRGCATFVFVPFEEVSVLRCVQMLTLCGAHFSLQQSILVFYFESTSASSTDVSISLVQVETSVLNLPVDRMDFYVPGWCWPYAILCEVFGFLQPRDDSATGSS